MLRVSLLRIMPTECVLRANLLFDLLYSFFFDFFFFFEKEVYASKSGRKTWYAGDIKKRARVKAATLFPRCFCGRTSRRCRRPTRGNGTG